MPVVDPHLVDQAPFQSAIQDQRLHFPQLQQFLPVKTEETRLIYYLFILRDS